MCAKRLPVLAAILFVIAALPGHAQGTPAQKQWPVSIDYPEDGSIFPPGISPPTFLWRDAAGSSWTIDIALSGKAAPIHIVARAERFHFGPLDPECLLNSDQQPKLTPFRPTRR